MTSPSLITSVSCQGWGLQVLSWPVEKVLKRGLSVANWCWVQVGVGGGPLGPQLAHGSVSTWLSAWWADESLATQHADGSTGHPTVEKNDKELSTWLVRNFFMLPWIKSFLKKKKIEKSNQKNPSLLLFTQQCEIWWFWSTKCVFPWQQDIFLKWQIGCRSRVGQGKYACFLYYCKIAIVLTALVLKIVLLFMFKFFF